MAVPIEGGTPVSEANSPPILSNLPSRYPRIAPAPAAKPKLLECLFEALRFYYSSATPLLEGGYDIWTIQDLLGHKDVSTPMIYTHVLNKGGNGVRSLVEGLSPCWN